MTRLGLMAKYWEPGQVKTRLASHVGAEAAARLHRAFLAALIARLSQVADWRDVVFTPGDRQGEFAQLAGDPWGLVPQSEGDLGARMAGYIRWAQSQRADRVVLLGADSPNLPVPLVEQGLAALDDAPVVLGPALDGGYYLLGIRGAVPPIFEQIDWGTGDVLAQTVEKLRTAKVEFHTLDAWYDVDELADLTRLRGDLAAERGDEALVLLSEAIDRALASR